MTDLRKWGQLARVAALGLLFITGCNGTDELGVTMGEFVVELGRSALAAFLL